MPNNQRVEDQAFGRTARQEKRGTGQMLLNSTSLISYTDFNPSRVKIQRDLIESNQLDQLKNNELILIQTKDKLFKIFCEFLTKKIFLDIRQKGGLLDKLKSQFLTPSVYNTNLIAAIEEQWAFFLQKLECQTISIQKSEDECNNLINRLHQEYLNNSVIKNHFYEIVIGNDLIVNESKPKDAIRYFKRAINSDDGKNGQFYGAAYVGMAWCTLLLENKIENKKIIGYFEKGFEILYDEMNVLNLVKAILENRQADFINTDLYKQLITKLSILGSYLNSIENCISVIKQSMRLINLKEITKINEKRSIKFKSDDKKEECNESDSNEKHQFFIDLERKEGKIDFKWKKDATYQVTFNDLTTHKDLGNRDQAIQTIDESIDKSFEGKLTKKPKSFSSTPNQEKQYNGIKLTLKNIGLDILKTLLNQNKEYEELSYDGLISKLESERRITDTLGLTNSFDVNLTIIYGYGRREFLDSRQINEIISIANERISDQSLRYDVVIERSNINSINKYFYQNRVIESNIEIQLDSLDYSKAKKLFSVAKATKISIETTLKKNELKSAIENSIINNVKVVSDSKCLEPIDKEELLKRVNKLKSDESPFV